MVLREVSIKNYMIHQDSKILLHPLTVLVGPNGGGKSSLFDALLNFSMVSRSNLSQAFGPYPFSFKATRFHGANNVAKIGFKVSMAESTEATEWLDYELDYSQTGTFDDKPIFTIAQERLVKQPGAAILFDRHNPDVYPISSKVLLENDKSLLAAIRQAINQGKTLEIDPLLEKCALEISRFNRFRLDPTVLAQPSRLPDPSGTVAPRLGYHGEELSAVLYHLNESDDTALTVIADRLRQIDSAFKGFDFNTVGTERIAFSASYTDSRQTIPSNRLSAGTLIFIGLIALVTTSNRPPVLMIEEPENGLTPQAIRQFYMAARELAFHSDPTKRSQVLMSSHSPLVICEAWHGDDRDFIYQVKVDSGRALVRRFSDAVSQSGIHLQKSKDGGNRLILGLKNAEEIMSGYLA